MSERLSKLMDKITTWAGDTRAFVGFWVIVLLWMLIGPLLGLSETWQLMINTPTTIVTTAMTFAILHVQNRDAKAVQTKLDDLIAAIAEADDDAIGLEHRQEKDIDEIHERIVQASHADSG